MPDTLSPLIVDLDGTLAKVDTLHEGLIALLCQRPWRLGALMWRLVRQGRAAMKAQLVREQRIDAASLPMRADFLTWLKAQAAAGRPLHLVSATNAQIVAEIAERLNIFAGFCGSDGTNNLKGEHKAAYLKKAFPDGFGYAGDSAADLAVWRCAKSIVLVGASPSVTRRAEALGRPIEARFDGKAPSAPAFFRECRLHQWSKNLLVFLPILLAHHFADGAAWLNALLAFLGMGVAASATYIVNDIADLKADRAHPTKRNRPLASGALGVLPAALLTPVMLAAGCLLVAAANLNALATLAVYLLLTLAYSFRLKRVPLLDTAIIGLLFTLRIVMGCTATDLTPSPWLLAFSLLLFFSLAMAKRQTEISQKAHRQDMDNLAGRGYRGSDVLLSLVYGVTTGVASLVILMLYTTNSAAEGLYRHPSWLWGMPLLIYLWQMRIWLLAHHGVLADDPIVFALKDRLSLLLGAGCAFCFYMAL